MNKTYNTKKGFSLLEMIVYISILVLMLGVIMSIAVSIVRSHRAIRASRSIENSAILSLERITREIRDADNVDSASSVFGADSGRLTLDSIDSSGNPRTVEFYLNSNTVFLKENGVDLGPLSQADALVRALVFRLVSSPSALGVRVEMTVESGTSTYYRTANFYTSANIR